MRGPAPRRRWARPAHPPRATSARLVLALLLAAAAAAPVTAADVATSAPRAWTLAALPDAPVPFHGLVNGDGLGIGAGGMLYPTGNLGFVGLLAAVATHAALIGGSRHSQESKLQLDADKVLEPYREVLAGLHLRGLQERALSLLPAGGRLRGADDVPAGELIVTALPAFALTPDASALVLDEVVLIKESGAAEARIEQALRIVSPTRIESDPVAGWIADDGALLKSTATQMQAQALAIAFAQMDARAQPGAVADDKPAMRTLRYALGHAEKMERAQLLEQSCDHLLMRNLRGAILSVPPRAGASQPPECASASVAAGSPTAPPSISPSP